MIKRLLDGKLKKLEEIDQNVLSLCTLETIEHEIEESDKVSAEVVEYQKKIQDAVQKHNEKMNSLTTTVSSPPQQMFNQGMYSHNPFGASPPTVNQVKAKLPKHFAGIWVGTFYDRISVHVRGLASLGISTEQYGSLLIPVVMSKLPNEIRLEVARNSTVEIWKIEDLLQTIKKEVEARETSEHVKTSEGSRKPPLGKPPIPSANSLVANTFGGNPVKCVYCKEYHYSASCERVKDPKKRKEILVKERRCLNCLRPGHLVSVCKNMKVCRHCGQSHHQSICPSLSSSRNDEKPTTSPPEREVSNTTTTNTVRNKGTVLLQAAKATAFNEDNSKSTHVRVLFDNRPYHGFRRHLDG